MIPFHLIFDHPQAKLGYLVRIIRITKGSKLLASNTFMRAVKKGFQGYMENYILTDPEKRED